MVEGTHSLRNIYYEPETNYTQVSGCEAARTEKSQRKSDSCPCRTFIYVYMCVPVCVYAHMYVLWRPEEGAHSPGAIVTGGSQLPDLGTGNKLGFSEER